MPNKLGNSFNTTDQKNKPTQQIEGLRCSIVSIDTYNTSATMSFDYCEFEDTPTSMEMARFLDQVREQNDCFELETSIRMLHTFHKQNFGTTVYIKSADIIPGENPVLDATAENIKFAQNYSRQNQKIQDLNNITIQLSAEDPLYIPNTPYHPKMVEGIICDIPRHSNKPEISAQFMGKKILMATYQPEDLLLSNRFMGMSVPKIQIVSTIDDVLIAKDPRLEHDFDPRHENERIWQEVIRSARGNGPL